MSRRKPARNAPCPCGSGRKYKNCCGRPLRQAPDPLMAASVVLPPKTKTYYLDTCVWSSILKSRQVSDDFVTYFAPTDRVAALSSYTLQELTRATSLVDDPHALFLRARHNIYISSLMDRVVEAEVYFYPKGWTMRWIPLHRLIDEQHPEFLTKLATSQEFTKSRDDHLQFGYDEF